MRKGRNCEGIIKKNIGQLLSEVCLLFKVDSSNRHELWAVVKNSGQNVTNCATLKWGSNELNYFFVTSLPTRNMIGRPFLTTGKQILFKCHLNDPIAR